MELSVNALLEKCLHGKTQNNNDSLNGVYVGRTTLEMGIDSAVINFNDGAGSILNVMKEYGLQDGHYASTLWKKKVKGE